uniref:Uncharacterized protein n=1 Tax=Glossina austeni TaxID=7395 RepID=A0A1A9V2H9_GLOAU
MLPNIRLPRVSTKLTTITVNKKNIKLKNVVIKRHLWRNFFSFSIFMRNCSARGKSKRKSERREVFSLTNNFMVFKRTIPHSLDYLMQANRFANEIWLNFKDFFLFLLFRVEKCQTFNLKRKQKEENIIK